MLWVGLRNHLQEGFNARLTEWEHAIILTLWGWILLQPHDVFASSPSYVTFLNFGVSWGIQIHENVWGCGFLTLGVVRLGALVVNGARKKVTPWMRAIGAALGGAAFIGLSIGFLLSGSWGTAMAVYPVLALFELFNYARATRDVGKSNAGSA